MALSFESALQSFKPALPLAVGLSGGADSSALLVACARRWPGRVHAFHVHHGLQAAADTFEAHCRTLCDTLGVPLHVSHVDARNAAGQSPEDAARQARYGAFEALLLEAPEIRGIALAQHADDQVETILLALSRGAGVAGLAAMPAQWLRAGAQGVQWYRPLLGTSAVEISSWLDRQGIAYVEDPTNADERYTRNRIRKHVLPALEQTFPQFRETFGRSADNAAQAAQLLDELAQIDLERVGHPPSIKALQALSRARQANVLRHWLKHVHATTPSSAQLGELLDQLAACTTRGHRIHLKTGRGYIQRKDGVLDWYN